MRFFLKNTDDKRNLRMRRFSALLAALLLAGSLTACGGAAAQEMQTAQVFAMDTVMGLQATGGETAEALAAAEDEIYRLDEELSRTREDSAVSQLNRAEAGTSVEVGAELYDLIARALAFSQATDGAFDITVAPLVNAWGFGFKDGAFPDSLTIDSLLQFTGWQKVRLTDKGIIEKEDPRLMLDCSAVAKGYAVDVVAHLLRRHGIHNFMVDIGGEVVVSGTNPSDQPWRIGINKPVDDSLSINGELQTVLHITQAALATSGNYRNFYYKDGKKYAHTIDPRTGNPVQHEILSATVIAPDCMSADAYATSFMVMGLQHTIRFLKEHPGIEAYLIYSTPDGKTAIYQTEGMARYFINEFS